MCYCKNQDPHMKCAGCNTDKLPKFQVGQRWKTRGGDYRWILVTNNVGELPIVVRDQNGSIFPRRANGTMDSSNSSKADLVELAPEPKTKEVYTIWYQYNDHVDLLTVSNKPWTSNAGTTVIAQKKVTLTEGEL